MIRRDGDRGFDAERQHRFRGNNRGLAASEQHAHGGSYSARPRSDRRSKSASRGSANRCTNRRGGSNGGRVPAYRSRTSASDQLGLQGHLLPINQGHVRQFDAQMRYACRTPSFGRLDHLAGEGLPRLGHHEAVYHNRPHQRGGKGVASLVPIGRQSLVDSHGDEGTLFQSQLRRGGRVCSRCRTLLVSRWGRTERAAACVTDALPAAWSLGTLNLANIRGDRALVALNLIILDRRILRQD